MNPNEQCNGTMIMRFPFQVQLLMASLLKCMQSILLIKKVLSVKYELFLLLGLGDVIIISRFRKLLRKNVFCNSSVPRQSSPKSFLVQLRKICTSREVIWCNCLLKKLFYQQILCSMLSGNRKSSWTSSGRVDAEIKLL